MRDHPFAIRKYDHMHDHRPHTHEMFHAHQPQPYGHPHPSSWFTSVVNDVKKGATWVEHKGEDYARQQIQNIKNEWHDDKTPLEVGTSALKWTGDVFFDTLTGVPLEGQVAGFAGHQLWDRAFNKLRDTEYKHDSYYRKPNQQ